MTGIFDWVTSLFSGKVTLGNIFQLLTDVSKIVTGLSERLGKIEARLDKLELTRGLDKVKDDINS